MSRNRWAIFGATGVCVVASAAVFAQHPDVPRTPQANPPTGAAPALVPAGFGQMTYWGPSGQQSAEAAQLAQQYGKATKPEEKQEIRKKLVAALETQFETNAKQQQAELEALEKQLAELKTLLKKRQDAKSTIIERRVEQMILDADGLGWAVPSGAYPGGARFSGGMSGAGGLMTTPAPRPGNVAR
jgi:hypothetical protein